MISEFQGQYRFLSNFWSCAVTLDGQSFPTVEHAYQAAKTLDMKQRLSISNAITPGDAKRLGRRVTIRADWEWVKIEVMRGLVRQKFQSSPLREKLLATATEELVEGNKWRDTFWGVYRGLGANNLGKILMEVRKEIKP